MNSYDRFSENCLYSWVIEHDVKIFILSIHRHNLFMHTFCNIFPSSWNDISLSNIDFLHSNNFGLFYVDKRRINIFAAQAYKLSFKFPENSRLWFFTCNFLSNSHVHYKSIRINRIRKNYFKNCWNIKKNNLASKP